MCVRPTSRITVQLSSSPHKVPAIKKVTTSHMCSLESSKRTRVGAFGAQIGRITGGKHWSEEA